MASIILYQPMDTSQFILGSPVAITAVYTGTNQSTIDFGTDLRLVFSGTDLTFSGLEPAGGLVYAITAQRSDGAGGYVNIGHLSGVEVAWTFTRAGLTAAYAAEDHEFSDSTGYDILRGGDQGDRITIRNAEDQVRAGAGDDCVILQLAILGSDLPPMDLDGGIGTDTLELSLPLG